MSDYDETRIAKKLAAQMRHLTGMTVSADLLDTEGAR